MVIWLIILIIIAVLILIVFGIYNRLIRTRNNVENAWSQIDVQLKKRYDLVPNLIETVKGYMKHERETLTEITQLRNQAMNAKDRDLKMKADDKMAKAVSGILNVVVENYPDLKANQNFLQLQEELSGIENKIAYSRQYYNDSVMMYNNKVQTVPTNMFAKMFNFQDKKFLETPETEKKNVKVSF
ncbi:MAG: LemA family protein [archaeon]